jgi:hypothetical protein
MHPDQYANGSVDSIAETIKPFTVDDVPSSSFNLIIGKRRSGKSYLCEDLVKKMIDEKMLDVVLLFSGTDAGFEFIGKDFRFIDNVEPLHQLVDNMKLINEFNKVAPKRDRIKLRVAVIIDDHAVKLKSAEFNILETLAVNGRHCAYEPLALHIFVLCQSLTKTPRVVRMNCDMIFFNAIASMREREIIFDENMYMVDSSVKGKRQARALYDKLVCGEDFCFICCLNHSQNVKDYKDYLRTYVAD